MGQVATSCSLHAAISEVSEPFVAGALAGKRAGDGASTLVAGCARSRAPAAKEAPAESGDLGVSFLNVARESGLNAKTIFGGEHKNKYLLETTGCGVAFYDYDNDGWLDIFLVNGRRLEGFPAGRSPPPICSTTIATARSPTSPPKPAWRTRAGDRASASAIMTTMVAMICSSPTSARTCSITTTATARLPM